MPLSLGLGSLDQNQSKTPWFRIEENGNIKKKCCVILGYIVVQALSPGGRLSLTQKAALFWPVL